MAVQPAGSRPNPFNVDENKGARFSSHYGNKTPGKTLGEMARDVLAWFNAKLHFNTPKATVQNIPNKK